MESGKNPVKKSNLETITLYRLQPFYRKIYRILDSEHTQWKPETDRENHQISKIVNRHDFTITFTYISGNDAIAHKNITLTYINNT